jgi:hypothetical protein
MSTQQITLNLTEKQLETIISGLLFSCSVNVVSNTNQEYQRELYQLAKDLKQVIPDIKLNDVQFIKEDNYEDSLSEELYTEFGTNMSILSFDQV